MKKIKYLCAFFVILLASCNKIYEITVEDQGNHKVYYSERKPYQETSFNLFNQRDKWRPTGVTIIETIDGEEIKVISGTITIRTVKHSK